METDARYSLAELARVTGVTPRTVRYYIAQGLLPGARESGPGAWYDEHHLARLRLIRELQRQHLPLAEIRSRLAELGNSEVAELLESQEVAPEPPQGSALDYIRNILVGRQPTPRAQHSGPQAPAGPLPPAPHQLRRSIQPSIPPPRMAALTLADFGAAASRKEAEPPSIATPPDAPTAERSQWDRIALTTDIELHVRRPLSRIDSKRVERLITIARQVLGEEQP